MNFKNWLTKADEIKENCQPFLRMTDQPLYRGVDISVVGMIKATTAKVRKDRRPRDSNLLSHRLADDWFYEKFKLRPRTQGLFCTSNKADANLYGTLVYVFPVGDFRYMWATNRETGRRIEDSLDYMQRIKRKMQISREAEGPEVTDAILSEYVFHIDEGLKDAQTVKAELILFCDEVILVPVNRIPNYTDFIHSLEK